MNIWMVMIAGGLLTYLIRLSFIYLYGKFQTPEIIQRSLRFVPPAVLSAILIPELFMHSGRLDIGFTNTRLLAGLVAIGVGLWRKNALLTITAGMLALLVLQYIP